MEVIKRSGEVVEFNPDKIYQAILKAAQVVYVLTDDLRQNLAQVTKKVAMDLDEAQVERATISMINQWLSTVYLVLVILPLQNTTFLIACNVIWNGAAMVITSPCICILSKSR